MIESKQHLIYEVKEIFEEMEDNVNFIRYAFEEDDEFHVVFIKKKLDATSVEYSIDFVSSACSMFTKEKFENVEDMISEWMQVGMFPVVYAGHYSSEYDWYISPT